MEYQLKRNLLKAFIFFVIFNSLFIFFPLIFLTKSDKVFVRFILFSDNYINTISEDRLNKLIKKKYKSGNNNLISEIFSNEEKRKLITLKNSNKDCRVQNDNPKTKLTFTDCLARNIASEVSEYLPLRKCDGLKGELKNKIIRVKKGIGCSSDFNESFMLHSQFVGLKVREVNDNRNTSSEYFDPEVKRWKWIDTSFRMQLVNKAGLILNSHNVSNQYLGDDLMFVDIYPLIDKKKSQWLLIQGNILEIIL